MKFENRIINGKLGKMVPVNGLCDGIKIYIQQNRGRSLFHGFVVFTYDFTNNKRKKTPFVKFSGKF